jgi:thymidylate synthase (FAD)
MHQDYSEGFVADQIDHWPDERRAGEICIKRLLAGERGHYGPLEHAQIVFNAGWFPHSVMQQARTHRVGVSFDVQSMRYTGDRICRAARGELDLEEVFYLRPVGTYSDRKGKKYTYTEHQRNKDLVLCKEAASRYEELILGGFAEEHARGILPFDYRQHFVVSFTMRALMHFLDLRSKLDAQEEIRNLCDLMFAEFKEWAPEIAQWYETNRLHRAKLAP